MRWLESGSYCTPASKASGVPGKVAAATDLRERNANAPSWRLVTTSLLYVVSSQHYTRGMPDATAITCHVRRRRADRGLSQAELADRVGLSRQAIVAIEAGRQVPSTLVALKLARTLACRVEDLFELAHGPRLSASLAPDTQAAAGARLALGRVDGVWAAHPIELGDRPGDGLLVGAGQPEAGGATVEPLWDLPALERNVLVAGCAPLLGVLTGCLARRDRSARATWIPANSTRALDLLAQGLVHVAGLHLVDSQLPGGHAEIVRAHLPQQAATIVNLTRWRQGFAVARGNPLAIRDVRDLLRPDVRFARRDPGAGAQKLVQRLLAASGLEHALSQRGPLVAGHDEVARLIRLGVADVGVTIEAAALAEGLDFVPLSEERFDLVVPRARLEAQPVAQLLDLIGRPAFQSDARRIAGYDLSTAGHAATVTAE